MGTAGILCAWALQGYFALEHCRDTWWFCSVRILCGGILCGCALQGYLVVGHGRDTLQLGISVKHCRDTHWLGAAGILGGCTTVSFQSGEDDIYFTI